MVPRFTLSTFAFFSRDTRLRFPFRYGIATMTEVPHQFVRVDLAVDGQRSVGLTSEGLPPKWFTKNPATPFAGDLAEMRRVIQSAASLSAEIARQPVSFFEYWRELERQQATWAKSQSVPPLLAHLSISLCERAVLDSLCRALNQPLWKLIHSNALGLRLGDIYPELAGSVPAAFLSASPLAQAFVRHTVGLADPLTPADTPETERVNDGLPQDLQSSIRAYGLRYFKVKLSGRLEMDIERLRSLCRLLASETQDQWQATLDGNEAFPGLPAFREYWEKLVLQVGNAQFSRHVLALEQPVHRDHALSDAAGRHLANWPEHPPIIIDESDGAVGDVPRALALGYAGASHKNCKGIVKGLANACLLAHRRRQGEPGLLTGEDLCNLGPVALLQDLAVMALLGLPHIERNGHHYYRGLSLWPADWQDAVLAKHPDLYRRHDHGFACLHLTDGKIDLGSVNDSPFGLQPWLDPTALNQQPAGVGRDCRDA